MRREDDFQFFMKIMPMFHTKRIARIAGIPGELGQLRDSASFANKGVSSYGNDDMLPSLSQTRQKVQSTDDASPRAGDVSRRHMAGNGIFQNRNLAIEHSNIDFHSPSGRFAIVKGRSDADCGEQARRQIAYR